MARRTSQADGAPDAATVAAAVAGLAERDIDPAPFLADLARRYPDLDLPQPDLADATPVLPRDADWVALQNICES